MNKKNNSSTTEGKKKTQPGWYLRLPYRYQHAFLAWKQHFEDEHGIEAVLLSGVMKAMDQFLKTQGIDPDSFPDKKPEKKSKE